MNEEVIELADWRIRKERGWVERREKDKCRHHNLTMDKHGFTVQCDDCKLQLSAYWVLERMLNSYREAREELIADRDRHKRNVMGDVRLAAARELESAWRSRKMVPTCPHCSRGIFPADGFGGAMVSKELEMARRRSPPEKRYGVRSAEVLALYEEAQAEAGTIDNP